MGRIADICGLVDSPPRNAELARLAARQHGVVTLEQLKALGLSARAVSHRAARGNLHRLYRTVYAVGHRRVSADGLRLAAVLSCGPGAVLSHRSAAVVWGLRGADGSRWDVTTPLRSRSAPTGVALHRTRALHADEVTVRDGIPITTVARTLVDLADDSDVQSLSRALNEAEVRRLFDRSAVEAALDRATGRRGVGRLRRAIEQPAPGLTNSRLEERFHSLIGSSDLPLPRLNATLTLGAQIFEVDALWPREKVIVELDSSTYHGTSRAFHADRARDLTLATQGFVVVRLTWHRVTRDGPTVLDELRRLLAVRGRPVFGGGLS